MKKSFCVLLAIVTGTALFAQDKTVQDLKNEATSKTIKKDPNDTIPKTWKKGGLYNLNFNQDALSNWAAGGDNSSLSLSTFLNLYAYYKEGRHSWDNTLGLAYGIVSTTSLGQRKADDRIDLLSKYGYNLKDHLFLSTLFNFRTQFAPGYAYPSGKPKVLTSNFLSPAYILFSEGLDYKPNDDFSLFFSPVTARWIIVKNDSLASVGAFGVDSGKHVKTQFGAFASITYKKQISPSALYNTRLDLFSNYLHNPQNISIFWTNLLAVKVTKYINMTFSVDMIYDDNIKTVKSDGTPGGPTVQLKELLGIGFAYKF
jgi:hypothetical protein